MESWNVVAGFEVITIIDASGRVISSTSRALTVRDLAPLFEEAERRGLPLAQGANEPGKPGVNEPRGPGRTSRRPTQRQVDQVRSEQRSTLDGAEQLGCDRQRVAELLAEFGDRFVVRALEYTDGLIGKGQEVRDPTGMVVSLVTRWAREHRES